MGANVNCSFATFNRHYGFICHDFLYVADAQIQGVERFARIFGGQRQVAEAIFAGILIGWNRQAFLVVRREKMKHTRS